jgi:hypothetical protein
MLFFVMDDSFGPSVFLCRRNTDSMLRPTDDKRFVCQ